MTIDDAGGDIVPVTYTVTITNQDSADGIAAALADYNANLPIVYEEDGVTVVVPTPGTLNSNQEYVQFVMARAADSYANHYGT